MNCPEETYRDQGALEMGQLLFYGKMLKVLDRGSIAPSHEIWKWGLVLQRHIMAMIYTHVLIRGGQGFRNPAEELIVQPEF